MPRKPNPPPNDAALAARLIEAAKLIDADKTGDAFSRALKIIVPVAAEGSTKKRKPKT